MEVIVLKPDESVHLAQGETLGGTDDAPLTVRYVATGGGPVVPPGTAPGNFYAEIERQAWEQMKLLSGRTVLGIYAQGERQVPLDVVPCVPTANAFVFADFPLYAKSQVFELAKSDLLEITPREKDTLIIGEKTYIVKKMKNGPCWLDVGSYGITIQIHTEGYRR